MTGLSNTILKDSTLLNGIIIKNGLILRTPKSRNNLNIYIIAFGMIYHFGENFQSLINLRYNDANPKAIAGNTKINSSIIDTTYLKTRSAIHYTKDQPSESHVLVEAYNDGLTASRILQNTTANSRNPDQ